VSISCGRTDRLSTSLLKFYACNMETVECIGSVEDSLLLCSVDTSSIPDRFGYKERNVDGGKKNDKEKSTGTASVTSAPTGKFRSCTSEYKIW